MRLTRFGAICALSLTMAVPGIAQELDVSRETTVLAILDDGQLLVRNDGNVFECALVPTGSAVELAGCDLRAAAQGDAAAILSVLSDDDWQEFVRNTLLDEECRLSTFQVIGAVLASAAEANGAAPETLDRARDALSERVEGIVMEMLSAGLLSFRGGELALHACP